MIDSELNEIKKRKTKRILLWVSGITATTAIITIVTILGIAGSLAGAQTSGGG